MSYIRLLSASQCGNIEAYVFEIRSDEGGSSSLVPQIVEDDFEDSLDFFGVVADQADEVLKMAKISSLVGEFVPRISDQEGVLMVILGCSTRHV
jgi:hypothetical protein